MVQEAKEKTKVHRFCELFNFISLSHPPANEVMNETTLLLHVTILLAFVRGGSAAPPFPRASLFIVMALCGLGVNR